MPESSGNPHNNHGDSLGKRYFYKLLTNLVSLPVYFVTQAIIPRGLGPQAYGDFNFLTNFFSQVMGFLDMGTSIGFYTKLSQRPHETALVSFYFYFLLVSVITLLGGVAVATQTSPLSHNMAASRNLVHLFGGGVGHYDLGSAVGTENDRLVWAYGE